MNFSKSKFGVIGVERDVVERYADLLNCKVLFLPFIYLDLPIGSNSRMVETWIPIVEKFSKKLATWKN